MNKKKRLLLINPVGKKSGFLLSRFSTFPPLGLAYVAAVTPSHWEVEILDENFDLFTFKDADLVGITAFTTNVSRAYEIAKVYRERGVKVVMGGIHVSMLPDEALQYVDSVVIGEVEGIWSTVLGDHERGALLPKYSGPQIDLKRQNVLPRHDLLNQDYLWHSVQTSRGCPFNCNFCSVSTYLGKEFRQRSPHEVLSELESIPGKYITFVDDNLIGYSTEDCERAKELFSGMIERNLRKKWWMQTSINAISDESAIKLAAKAGCMYAFIGFETIRSDTLKDMKKGINIKIGIDNYKKVVETFHRNGIGVLGAFIIGNDHESPEYYKELARFLIKSNIDIIQITLLTPLPGTALMEQLKQEGRLIYENFPQDWDKYRFSYMVHQPEGVEIETIYNGNNYVKDQIYSFPTLQFRLLKSLINIGNATSYYAVKKANLSYKKGWLNSHYHKNYPTSL